MANGEEGGRESTTTKQWTLGGDEGESVANILRTAGPSVSYVTSVKKPSIGKRVRRSRSSGSGARISRTSFKSILKLTFCCWKPC